MSTTIAIALVLLLFTQGCSGATAISVPKYLQCPSSQFFDSTGLQCIDCDSSSLCGCQNSLLSNVECTVDDQWKGNCQSLLACSADECSSNNQSTSLDQRSCITCSSNNSLYESSSEYDTNLNECTCNNPIKDSSSGTKLVNHRLVEIYDDTSGLPLRVDCVRCPNRMAVIRKDLYESDQQFYVTAGKMYTADPHTCVSCPNPNMYFDTDYSCVCDDDYILTGEASIGTQSCIKNSPTISSSFSRVRYQDPNVPSRYDFSVESMTFSHLYMRVASECEYYDGSSKSLESCQALANLCVLQMLNEETSACQQLETISQRRVNTYHGVDDWTQTLPWLYYRDEAQLVTNDRSLNMQISFQPELNRVNQLTIKLAKYTLNGTFLGLDDLSSNEFEYCLDSSLNQPPHWLNFGMSYRRERPCSIYEQLQEQDMFFYDMYIVDNTTESCAGGGLADFDCLFPIPVLNKNLVKDKNQFPNSNTDDDVYTRRFFLFDNVSAQTSSGVEAIRYAKKLVLQIQTQTENPSKIYPPRLIIEYEMATKVSDEDTLLLKVEYSMKTEVRNRIILINLVYLQNTCLTQNLLQLSELLVFYPDHDRFCACVGVSYFWCSNE